MATSNAINVQARLDICTLATLARAYTEEKVFIRSKSDLVWKAMEQIVGLYERQGVERITDVYEALEFLDNLGLQLDTSKRTVRQVKSAKLDQVAKSDFGVPSFRPVKREKVDSAEAEKAEREIYRQYVEVLERTGQPIPSFAEYREGLRKVRTTQQEENVVSESLDVASFEKKEADRLRAEKEAYAAMLSMRSISGSSEGDD